MKECDDNRTARSRQVRINGRGIDLAALEAALREGSPIEESVVLPREAGNGVVELVAYVVPTLPYAPDHLEARVKTRMPSGEVRCFCVPVAPMPLTEAGEFDDKALTQLPVVHEGLLQRWEEQLRALPGIRQAAVVVQEQTADHAPLHLSDDSDLLATL